MSEILMRGRTERVFFDPTNNEHLESFKLFLRTGNWGKVQFYPELPYLEVPATVQTKYALHSLGVKPETRVEYNARIATKNLVQAEPAESEAQHAAHLKAASQWIKTSGAENWPL